MSGRFVPPKLDFDLCRDDVPLKVSIGGLTNLYIGSEKVACNQEELQRANITHIINLSQKPEMFPEAFHYLNINIAYKDEANILACIPFANIFIESGMDSGGVLVHCFAGKSRSSAVIMGFLLSAFPMKTFDELYDELKNVRSQVDIKRGLQIQLRAYAAAKFDVFVAQQLLMRRRIDAIKLLRGNDALLKSGAQSVGQHASSHLDLSSLSSGSQVDKMIPTHVAMDMVRAVVTPRGSARSRGNSFDIISPAGKPINRGGPSGSPFSEKVLSTCSNVANQDAKSVDTPSGLSSLCNTSLQFNAPLSRKPSRIPATVFQTQLSSVLDFPFVASTTPPMTYIGPHTKSRHTRLMPPLMGSDQRYRCWRCKRELFCLASAIRVDIDISSYSLDETLFIADGKEASFTGQREGFVTPPMSSRHSSQSKHDFNFDSFSSTSSNGSSSNSSSGFGSSGDFTTADYKEVCLTRDLSDLKLGSNISASSKGSSGDKRSGDFNDNYNYNCTSASDNGFDVDFDVALKDGASMGGRGRPKLHLNVASLANRVESSSNNGALGNCPPLSSRTDTNNNSNNNSNYNSNNNSNNNSNYNSNSSDASYCSPRLPAPEGRYLNGNSPRERPQSAERRKWTTRLNLLNSRHMELNRQGVSRDGPIAKLADDDSDAFKRAHGSDNAAYIYLEYNDWMGTEMFNLGKAFDTGFIKCPNTDCLDKGKERTLIGSWLWSPSDSQSANGKLGAPIIRIEKSWIEKCPIVFDETPTVTPRNSTSAIDEADLTVL